MKTGFGTDSFTRLDRLRRAAGAVVAVVGALVLLGWLFDNYALKSAYSSITMKANTALALLLVGASLWAFAPAGGKISVRRGGQVCAAIVLLIGALTLSQHLFGWNLGIDQWLFTEPLGATATTSPGRMGPPASTCFTLSGIALLLLHAQRAVLLAQVLSIIVSLWALLAIIGFSYGAKQLYDIANFTGIAPHTAVTLLLLSLGLLAARGDQAIVAALSSDRAGGAIARRLLPAAISVSFLLGWLSLLGERAGHYNLSVGTALLVLAIIIIFTALVWQNAARMNEAEEELREREAELREAQRLGHFGNWYWNAQTDVTTGSDELLRIYGLDPTRDTMPNFTAQDGWLYPHESWQRINAAVQQALTTGIGYELDVQALRNSAPIWITTRSEVVRNADGKIVGLRGTVQDITERKRAEEALREGEAREHARAEELAAVMEIAPAAIWVAHDPDCREITGNNLGHAVLRVQLDGNLSKSAPAPNQPQHFRVYENGRELATEELPMQRAARGEAVPEIEVEHRFNMGERIFLFGGTAPLKDAEGSSRGAVGVFIDITERKLAELEREELLNKASAARAEAEAARALAENANRSKDEFIAVVSHELRSPLNAILGYNRILRSNPRDVEQVSKTCEIIERNARIQLQLIEDLLDTARIISGKFRLDVQPLDLVSVLTDALDTVRPAAEAKNIELRAHYDLQPEVINGDAARLQQVIWNLLSNAIKFTPEGGRVELRMERSDAHTCITVSDTGKGIEQEFLPYVFDRFRQADGSTTRRYGGLGLGLALVKSLVELHGGEIKASSAGLGHGASFTVKLPLLAQTAGAATPTPVLATSEAQLADALPLPLKTILADVNVLVVDDQEEARVTLSHFLSECGARVTALSSGIEALAWLSSPPGGAAPDVLVCDIAMPDEDGYSVLRRVRALEAALGRAPDDQLPAVALTALAHSEDRLRALTAGFRMHVAKPVEPAELALVIASVITPKTVSLFGPSDN